ncbi:hypothetical protein J6590_030477 [Homalodisca vitripennis]|nr:hypothetical protein J6590_030477 [Homalodisca vitripennis]
MIKRQGMTQLSADAIPGTSLLALACFWRFSTLLPTYTVEGMTQLSADAIPGTSLLALACFWRFSILLPTYTVEVIGTGSGNR